MSFSPKILKDTLTKKVTETRTNERLSATSKGIGDLRGAMSGAVLKDGRILAAKCPRLDVARALGYESATTEDDQIMFAAGYGHEKYLEGFFTKAGIPYTADTENRFRLALTSGRMWEGTPDFDIEIEGKKIGVEAKCLTSMYSVTKERQSPTPYMRHLLQCVNYMIQKGRTEWLLIVGNYFRGSNYNFQTRRSFDFAPTNRWHLIHLDADAERLWVRNEQEEDYLLPFTVSESKAYIQLLDSHIAAGTLPPKAVELEMHIKPYNRYDRRYYPMASYSNLLDNGKITVLEWLNALKKEKK